MKLPYLIRKAFRLDCPKKEIFEKFIQEINEDITMCRTDEISLTEKYKDIRDHVKKCKNCKMDLEAYLNVTIPIGAISYLKVKESNITLDKVRAKIIKDIFLDLEIKPSPLMQISVGAVEELLKETGKKDTEK